MLCFYEILQKESLQSSGLFFFFHSWLFFSYKESFPMLLPELTFLFFLYSSVSPLFPSLLTLDDSYKTICRVHTFKVQVPFNISPSCNLPSGFCFALLWAIRSVTQNNSTKCFVFRASCSETTELKEGNLLSFCSFSFFLCVICLFNLFTSAWKDSTTRSLFSTSMQTA